jgi:hypothetical protein
MQSSRHARLLQQLGAAARRPPEDGMPPFFEHFLTFLSKKTKSVIDL